MKHISQIGLFVFIALLLIQFACKKDTNTTPVMVTGTLSDRDGNLYKTIKIGNQTWMAENLKVKTYQNGDSILNVQDAKKWTRALPAYCLVNKDNKNLLLYNWYALNDPRKFAPTGWHIPSDAEWKTLEINLGMSAVDAEKMNWRGNTEGDKLKIEQAAVKPPNVWINSDDIYKIWPNNESGFSAYANGCRLFTGVFGDPGIAHVEFYWSSTEKNDQAWYRYLDYNKSGVFRFYGDKRYGFSVRCIKD